MCGIVGIAGNFSREEGLAVVGRMNDSIAHRGPDDEGAWATNGFAFGMRRLSIIDIAGGRQPMWNEHGIGIVFNGEIYNYMELREKLQRKGYSFKTTSSDTEVIPNLYHSGGIEALGELEGMFAICLHDPKSNCIYLVRDRLGIKPLYYGERNGRFYFASEIKAIIAGMGATPQLNRPALHHYLTLRYVPAPETVWAGIFKLEPGHYLKFDLATGHREISRYWKLDFLSAQPDPDRDYVKEFEELFLSSVHKHLVASDVPVGVMLSGGLDSSAVSAAAVEMGHKNFHTFTVGFDEGGDYSEVKFARQTAERIKSRHFEVIIGKKEFLDFIPEMVRFSDEPLADLASIPLHFVSRLARQHVKTVLTGEGSDEILAGYNMEVAAERLDQLKGLSERVPAPVLKLMSMIAPGKKGLKLKHLAERGWSGYLRSACRHMTSYWTEDEKRGLWKQQQNFPRTDDLIRSWYDTSRSPHPLDQLMQVYSHSWLVEDLLMKADKMSMATSLELRVPFLHHPLVEWAFSLPLEWKVGGAKTGYVSKRILREFARTRIPKSIIERPKLGFPVPAYEWLKGDTGAWAEKLLSDKNSFTGSLFDMSKIKPALEAARRGDDQSAHKIWIMIILEHWGKCWM